MERITLEQDLIKANHSLSNIEHLTSNFESYGRYAFYYDKNYIGGKQSRFHVRKTLRKLTRLMKVIAKKSNLDDFEEIRQLLHLQIRYSQVLHKLTF